jgi:ubiquitin C-terminal hydrolase
MGQHDSIEFLRTLLDDISKEININQNISAYKELITEGKSKQEQNKEYHNFFLGRENSVIIDIFYIQTINIFTCKCGFESYSFQKLLDIPLLLPMKIRETDLISLIKEYLKEETLDWSKECEKCKKANLEHVKKIKFSMINDVVIFSLQRIDPYFSMKSNCYVSYKEYIDLKEFCDYDLYKENTKYRLFGTINHIGNIDYGHYYAYVRIGDIWYEFNDSIVKKINYMEYNSSSVCVLFYEKIE